MEETKKNEGYPLRVSEILKEIRGGVAFLSRTKVSTPQDVIRTKKQIKKSLLLLN